MTIVGMALALTGMPKNALAEEVSVEAGPQQVSVAAQATDKISSDEIAKEDADGTVEVQTTDNATSTDETTLDTSEVHEAVIEEVQTNDTDCVVDVVTDATDVVLDDTDAVDVVIEDTDTTDLVDVATDTSDVVDATTDTTDVVDATTDTAEEDEVKELADGYYDLDQQEHVEWFKDQLAQDKDAWDKIGSTIKFDFNNDGKTDAQDFIDFEMYHAVYHAYFADTDWVALLDSNGNEYVDSDGDTIWFNYDYDENGDKIYFIADGEDQFIFNGENEDGTIDWVKSDKQLIAKFGKASNGGLWLTGYLQMALNGNLQDVNVDESLNLDKVKSYYLTNIGQATDVKNQAWFGNCWAFGNVSALESAILKAKAGDNADLIDITQHVAPKLNGLKNDDVDISELMIAWYGYIVQQSGSQQGEGEGWRFDKKHPDSDASHFKGGNSTICESLWTAFQGLATEGEVPYWPQDKATGEFLPFTYETYQRCWKSKEGHDFKWAPTKPNDGKDVPVHIKGVKYLPVPNYYELVRNEDGTGIIKWVGHNDKADLAIKEALVKHGAVAISYNADISLGDGGANTDFINKVNFAQYQDTDYTERTHLVNIVGWNDDYDASNFATGINDPSKIKNGAWLCKNSWGSYDYYKDRFGLEGDDNPATWGIKDENGNPTGFFWLSYYDHTITYANYYDVELPDENGEFKTENAYVYDFARNGANTALQFQTYDTGTEVANVFTAEKDEQLKQISVRTSESDSDVHVRIFLIDADDNLDDFDPTNGSEAVIDFTTHAKVAGFQLIDLPEFLNLKAGQKFAIVENIVSKDHKDASKQVSYIALETSLSGYAASDDNPEHGLHYVCNDGESFVKVLTKDGYKWMSPQQLDENYFGGETFIFGNALIKAYTADIPHYQVIAGDAQALQSNKMGDVTFAFNGDFEHFQKVLIDGTEVAKDNYSAVEGSTIITFKGEFMESLDGGSHTVTAVYDNGAEASATFLMIKMVDESTQTDTEVVDEGTQTDDKTTVDDSTQTDDKTDVDDGTQTDDKTDVDNGTQTDDKTNVDDATQTDTDETEEITQTDEVKDKEKGPKPLPLTPTEKKAVKPELPQTGDMTVLPEIVAAAVAAFGIGFKKRDEE